MCVNLEKRTMSSGCTLEVSMSMWCVCNCMTTKKSRLI